MTLAGLPCSVVFVGRTPRESLLDAARFLPSVDVAEERRLRLSPGRESGCGPVDQLDLEGRRFVDQSITPQRWRCSITWQTAMPWPCWAAPPLPLKPVIQVRGKGDKNRRIPVEPVLVDVLEHYLDSRKISFPNNARRSSPTGGLAGCRLMHRCSSVATANASPAAHCSIACCALSDRPASTVRARKVLCYMAFDIPSPPNWPTPMSAFTS